LQQKVKAENLKEHVFQRRDAGMVERFWWNTGPL
jgi:hypothetical protein